MGEKQAKAGLKLMLGLFVYASTTLVVLAALGFWWAASSFTASGPLEESKLVSIESGSGLRGIAAKLESEGAVESAAVFIFGTRILGAQSALQAGEYELQAGMSARDIMNLMREGETVKRRFTIREGLTSYEIVRVLDGVEQLSGTISAIPDEGSLLPNTYDYKLDETRDEAVLRLQSAMVSALMTQCQIEAQFRAFKDLMGIDCVTAPAPLKTVGEVLTLASIVEKETGVSEERRTVAGVFLNRLRKNIALQTDPTVIYAITKGKHKNDGKGPLGRRLLSKDLKIDSPYNTYKYPGLPPGPIANPGKASIEAVLNPEQHEYIYFVADGTGGHVFAKTLSEHNTNVAKWRKIRQQKN